MQDLIQLYLILSPPKQALSQIFVLTADIQSNQVAKWIAANIVGLYCSQELRNPITLKTFEKEYVVDAEVTHLRSRVHSSVAFLTEKIICEDSEFAMWVLMWIPQLCSWTTIPLLSFPVSFTYSKSDESNKL